MLIEDGFRPSEINQIIAQDNQRYKQITEKMLCRLHTYGESKHRGSDLYLMPWCLDKWRRYIKERKAMGYHLYRTGQIAKMEEKKLKEYFYRWYNTKP